MTRIINSTLKLRLGRLSIADTLLIGSFWIRGQHFFEVKVDKKFIDKWGKGRVFTRSNSLIFV